MARFDFELKLIRKTLMNRYPWIKDVKADPETSNKYRYSEFIDIYYDIHELAEMEQLNIEPWVINRMKYDGGTYKSSYLQVPFAKEDGDKVDDILIQIKSDMKKIHNTNAIPKELKTTKTPSISMFYAITK